MAAPTWTRSRLLAAGGSGLLRFVVSAPAYFVSVPVLLMILGRTYYGVWVLITTLTGWLFLSDLGLRTVVVREASIASADQSSDRLSRRVGVICSLYVAITIFLAVAGWFGLRPLVYSVLRIPADVAPVAVAVLALGGCAFCIDLIGLGLFRGVSDGTGFVALNNLLAVGYTWLRTALILGVAWATKNVVWMAGASVAASMCGLLMWRWTAWRALPGLHYRPRFARTDEVREILGFAGVVQINDAVAAATPQLIEAVVVRRFGLGSLGLFDVGVQLYVHVRSMSFVSWFPVMPWLAARGKAQEKDTAAARRLTTTATLASASGAAVAGLVLSPLISIWLPQASAEEVATIVALVAAGAIIGSTAPAAYAWNAQARPWKMTVVLGVFLGAWLVPVALTAQSLHVVAIIAAAAALASSVCANLLVGSTAHSPERVISLVLLAGGCLAATVAPASGVGLQMALNASVALLASVAFGLNARTWLIGEASAA